MRTGTSLIGFLEAFFAAVAFTPFVIAAFLSGPVRCRDGIKRRSRVKRDENGVSRDDLKVFSFGTRQRSWMSAHLA